MISIHQALEELTRDEDVMMLVRLIREATSNTDWWSGPVDWQEDIAGLVVQLLAKRLTTRRAVVKLRRIARLVVVVMDIQFCWGATGRLVRAWTEVGCPN